jgi:hypothetical protein
MPIAALPAGFRKVLGGTLDQAHAGVGDDQLDAVQAALLEMAQEGAPARLVLLGALDDAKNLAVAVAVDRDPPPAATRYEPRRPNCA